jgi:hypothetical protein
MTFDQIFLTDEYFTNRNMCLCDDGDDDFAPQHSRDGNTGIADGGVKNGAANAEKISATAKKGPSAGDVAGGLAAGLGKGLQSAGGKAPVSFAQAPAMPEVSAPAAVAPVQVAHAPTQTVAVRAPSFKKGGKIGKTGVYILHRGERVLNKKQTLAHDILTGKTKPTKTKTAVVLLGKTKGAKPTGK